MTDLLQRWRLILGPGAEGGGQGQGGGADGTTVLGAADGQRDRMLEYLYGREYDERRYIGRGAGRERSTLSAPQWLSGVRELFPRSTAEAMQRQALERYGLSELLADPQVLAQATPSMDLVRTLIACRSLLPDACMAEARRLIRRVVQELEARLSRSLRDRVRGRRQRGRHGGRPSLAALDWPTTLRRNLKHYDPESGSIVLERLYFNARHRRQLPWELILLVDQSGSMVDSVIHAAVTAAIFSGLSVLNTRLVLFDTQVVDVSDRLGDPVDVLLGVQLGGGTDIAAAMAYAASQIGNPTRSMLVLVSDFYEGGDREALLAQTRRLAGSGVKLLGLAALDRSANPDYDHHMAQALTACGMAIGAMTPDRLADWVAGVMA